MLNRIKRLYRRWRARHEDSALASLIAQSDLFDRTYYLQNNPDVAQSGIDPLTHYLENGRKEGRLPSLHFDPKFYLSANPDVAQTAVDPHLHYIRHGRAEGRPAQSIRQIILKSGLFDADYYRAANLDVALSGQDMLQHYLDYGRYEGRRPSLDFDPQFYVSQYADLQSAEIDPFVHYILDGRKEGRRCRESGMARNSGLTRKDLLSAMALIKTSGQFDAVFYLRQSPAVRDAGVDPHFHYLVGRFCQHLDPAPAFSTIDYLQKHADVKKSGVNPLLHSLDADVRIDSYRCAEASAWLPIDAVLFERTAGFAFLDRFGFSSHPAERAGKYSAEAVSVLASQVPKLILNVEQPDVSILIPVYGQLHFVLNCLDSLSRQQSRFSAEIIVADDASPEASQTGLLAGIPWIRYVLRSANSGFIDTCNDAAKAAQGRYLVFLNSDTRVAAGWLDELIGSFDLFPKAGLVGSSLFNEDASLQEAGGIYWNDGSAWNYGRNQSPNHPKYGFARPVDYVSGASIALLAEVWRQLEGFDIAYRPAYCEDADLAFRLRQAGYEVWLQPLSRVLHYEGKTHGRDLEQGGKAYQKSNARRLAERWKTVLSTHAPNGREPDREANRTVGDRILVLDAVTPMPDRDSGSFITVRMLRALLAMGYHVTFVPQHGYRYEENYTPALQRLGIECVYFPEFNNITEVLAFQSDFDFVLGYRFTVLDPVYAELRKRIPAARIIFHTVDLHFVREEREAILNGSRSRKIRAALTRSGELELIAKADCSIVHTKAEAAIVEKHIPVDNLVEFPYIAELHPTHVPFESRRDIMFLGGFRHPPNVDAVKHFVSAVWPRLLARLPESARFVIVGPSAPPEILALAGPRIVVAGHVEELQGHFETARVFVAPLRYGAGIKGKVIQALCYGTPSVISSIAAEGMGLVSGQHTIVADDDGAVAENILTLYSDPEIWYRLQAAGYAFIEANYSWNRCLEIFKQVLDTADATWLARQERKARKRLDEITGMLSTPDLSPQKESERSFAVRNGL